MVRPTLTYDFEIWPLTKKIEQNIIIFENKLLRKIYGFIFDVEKNKQRIKYNKKLREEIGAP